MEHQNLAPFTGVILAGGQSRRMGQNKAQLEFEGKTLLEHQVEKLRRVGAAEILISGEGCQKLPGTKVVADILPNRGPLGGLHACLQVASYSRCLVLSVDAPLVPVETLRQICATHSEGATVLSHGEYVEPLIGMYDSAVAQSLFALIENGGAPVRALKNLLKWNTLEYQGDENLLCNCNTRQEFADMKKIADKTKIR